MGESVAEKREKSTKSSSSRKPVRPIQGEYTHRFVRIELTAEHKEQFRALLAAGEFDRLVVDDYTTIGQSVKFSKQDGGKTCTCTVTCSVEGDPNNGLMLTGRGSDAATALAVVAFKDTYLCDDQMWATGESATSGRGGDIG